MSWAVERMRDRYEPVAALADQSAKPGPFGAHHDGGWEREVDVVIPVSCIAGKSDGPHTKLFQLLDRARDVDFGCDSHESDGTGGCLRRNAIE